MHLRKAARHSYWRRGHAGHDGEEHRAEAICHCPARIYRTRRAVEYPEKDSRHDKKHGQRVQAGLPAPEQQQPHEHRGEKNRAGEQFPCHDEAEHDDEQPRKNGDERIEFFVPQSHYFFMTPDFFSSREMMTPMSAPTKQIARTAMLMPTAIPAEEPMKALTACPSLPVHEYRKR